MLWALALSAAMVVVFILTLSPGYETNDDVGMQAMVDGTMGEHSPHLVFTNVLIGLVLSTLYRAVDWFPWYGLYLYLAHFACLLTVVYVALAVPRGRLWVRLLSLAAVVAVFHLPMWMALQFTSTSMLLAASGVMLSLAVAQQGTARWGAIVAAGAMVGFSSWIRWPSLWAVALIALPAVALTIRRIPWRRAAVLAGTAIAVLLAGSIAQAAYYAGKPDWQAYFALNERRNHIQHASGLSGLDPAVLDEVGWSRNDLEILDNFFFADETVHEAGDLEVIADALPIAFRPAEAVRAVAAQVGGWLGGARLAVVVALAALAWVGGGRRAGALVLVTSAAALAVAFGVAGALKLPDRVGVPMLAVLPLLFLATPPIDEKGGPPGSRPGRRLWATIVALVLLVALAIGAVNAHALNQNNISRRAHLMQVLSGLQAIDPDGLFVWWGAQLPLGAGSVSPWEGPSGPNLIGVGWQQRSPLHRAMLARFGIDDLFAAIAGREDVYLPLRGLKLPRIYLRYLEEHYGFVALLRPVAQTAAGSVYNLAVAYQVDEEAGALIEHHLDGTSVSYPLDAADIPHRAVAVVVHGGQLTVRGRVAADLVVVTREGGAIALTLSNRPRPSPGTGLPGFRVTVPDTGAPVRVFAISGDRAVEITR
ncbi:MAG TPA: hypothetical protein VLS92_06710 [Acidimicrobiia bacterium]|nr:hypothetical protein [Acidimicrobiia bacterium]